MKESKDKFFIYVYFPKDDIPTKILISIYNSISLDVEKSGIILLKSGDKVRVNLTQKAFKQLQDNAIYGGWDVNMDQVSFKVIKMVNCCLIQ